MLLVDAERDIARKENRAWHWHYAADSIAAYYDTLALTNWISISPVQQGAIRKRCADVLATGLVMAENKRWEYKQGATAIRKTFESWQGSYARQIVAKANTPIMWSDGDLTITGADVELAIQEAARANSGKRRCTKACSGGIARV
jgi:hypothetical protein